MTDAPFHRIGPERPVLPVILSVPHAGRDYPPSLLDSARVPVSVLEALEDRLVDRLIWRAVAAGATAFVVTLPRAAIDLNRDEREIDPAMIAPPPPAHSLLPTARTRGGLGLIPARLAGAGALWRGRISREELKRRVETVHRPFHSAIGEALSAAKQRFGAAILLDCHSMPPRPHGEAKVILGDRHGRTIAAPLLEAALTATRALGYAVACNDPYAGGHVIERHGKPGSQVHALQIEIDRSAYLDPTLREPGPGFDSVSRLIAAVADALNSAIIDPPVAIAAE